MKIKIGNKVYDGEKEPVMIILSNGEKEQIQNMHSDCTKYCVYPNSDYWKENDFEKIKQWMKTDE